MEYPGAVHQETPRSTSTVFPDPEWATGRPEDLGLDSALLKKAADEVFRVEKRHGLVVVKGGVIVHETYARDAAATSTIYSLTKGLGATLVGIAQTRGMLHVNDAIADWLPVHHPEIAAGAQIRHVLNMTASRAPVGSWWEYNSGSILNSIPNLLWLASGLTPHAFYQELLRAPLSFDFDWPHNARGWLQIGSRGPLPVIQATHRDVARLGLLWLERGRWRGEQLMDAAFVDEALRPAHPDANGAYGYLWWLNGGEGTWRTPGGGSGTGRFVPQAPRSVYFGLGARGKILVVVPEHDLIVVSMGETGDGSSAGVLPRIWRAIASFLPA